MGFQDVGPWGLGLKDLPLAGQGGRCLQNLPQWESPGLDSGMPMSWVGQVAKLTNFDQVYAVAWIQLHVFYLYNLSKPGKISDQFPHSSTPNTAFVTSS